MHNLSRVLLGFYFCFTCLVFNAYAGLEAGKYAKVYSGGEGLKVEIVDVVGAGEKQKLVRVSGIDSSVDDVVLLHQEVPDGRGAALQTIVNDQPFWTIQTQNSRWGGKEVLLTLPEDLRKKHHLYYDEKASNKVDKNSLVALYAKQQADGRIRKVQLYSGSDVKPHTKRTLKEAVDDAKGACGAPIGTKLDWDSIDKKALSSLPIASLCRQPADLLARQCREDAGFKKKAAKITGFTCSAGETQKLTFNAAKRLLWVFPKNKPIDTTSLFKTLKNLVN